MKPHLIACASIAWVVVACGCSSGGAGPASPPFNPFGTETAGTTGPETTVGGDEVSPGAGARTIEQLCAVDCARIGAVCPGAVGPNCVSSCSSTPASAPGCTAEIQAYLACVSTAPLTCTGGAVQIPSCDNAIIAVSNCANQATAASM